MSGFLCILKISICVVERGEPVFALSIVPNRSLFTIMDGEVLEIDGLSLLLPVGSRGNISLPGSNIRKNGRFDGKNPRFARYRIETGNQGMYDV